MNYAIGNKFRRRIEWMNDECVTSIGVDWLVLRVLRFFLKRRRFKSFLLVRSHRLQYKSSSNCFSSCIDSSFSETNCTWKNFFIEFGTRFWLDYYTPPPAYRHHKLFKSIPTHGRSLWNQLSFSLMKSSLFCTTI